MENKEKNKKERKYYYYSSSTGLITVSEKTLKEFNTLNTIGGQPLPKFSTSKNGAMVNYYRKALESAEKNIKKLTERLEEYKNNKKTLEENLKKLKKECPEEFI